MLAGSLVTITDGLVNRKVIREKWNHWSFTPLNLGLDLLLMG